MNIALLGFGGMGRTVHRIALERGHEVPVIVDPHTEEASSCCLSKEILEGIDVAIDFSHADAILDNVKICKEAGVNLVVGTTGWNEKMEEVKKLIGDAGKNTGEENTRSPEGFALDAAAKGYEGPSSDEWKGEKIQGENQSKIGFLWSSNFSIGVNLYFKIVEEAARLINNFDEYDIWGHEIHHSNKADSPSGTARTLEQILLKNIGRKTVVVEDRLNRKREDHEIHFSSVRGGLVNFGHTIGFDSPSDRILISHEARNRDGYALGAVKAAEWLIGPSKAGQAKKGFFSMGDFLNG